MDDMEEDKAAGHDPLTEQLVKGVMEELKQKKKSKKKDLQQKVETGEELEGNHRPAQSLPDPALQVPSLALCPLTPPRVSMALQRVKERPSRRSRSRRPEAPSVRPRSEWRTQSAPSSAKAKV